MQTSQIELPLFNFEPNQKQTQLVSTSPKKTTVEEKLIPPLVKILEGTNPATKPQQSYKENENQFLKRSLDSLFPEQQYKDKDIQKANEILGKTSEVIGEDCMKDVLTEIQFLASTWLDNFERELFDGRTLQELLHEKGGI